MGFSTRCWKSTRRAIYIALVAGLLSACSLWVEPANELEVARLTVYPDRVEPVWQLSFSDSVMAALDSGVSLELVEQLQWLDQAGHVLDESSRRYRVSHRLLTGNFLIEAFDGSEPRGFPGRRALLRGLQRPGAWRLSAPDQAVALRLRVRMDRTRLPGSLRMQASWDHRWRSHSPWLDRSLLDKDSS